MERTIWYNVTGPGRPGPHVALMVGALCLAAAGTALSACSPSPVPQPSPGASASSAVSSPSPAASNASTADFVLVVEPMDTRARLSWHELPGADGYLVYRDSASAPLDDTPTHDVGFDDIGLTNGRTYTYVVAAVAADGTELARTAAVAAVPRSR